MALQEGTKLSAAAERINELKMHLIREMGGPVAQRRAVEEALDSLPKLVEQNESQRRMLLLSGIMIVLLLVTIGILILT